VVAPDCASADALATACMVLGHEAGLALIEKIADIEAYFIYNNGSDELSVVMTSGFQSFLND
jgi:thiamine biosynthesis lipoprotein